MTRNDMVKSIASELILAWLNTMGIRTLPPFDKAQEMADSILLKIELEGMLPPKMFGVYDNVPTVTPTGNLDYGFKRGWEPEPPESEPCSRPVRIKELEEE